MAQQHTVQAGDTVGAVAKRYNVPNSAVSGFRSKDPNVIFPDEVLQIDDSQVIGGAPAPVAQPGVQQQGQVVDGNALQPTGGLPQGPAPAPVVQQGTVVEGTSLQPTQGVPAPTTAPVAQPVAQPAPVQAPVQAPAPTGDPALDSITQGVQQAQLQAADIQRQMDELLNAPDVVGDQVNGQTDGGVDNTPEAKSSEFFSQFGVSSDALGQGLNNNPFGTISDLVSQVMKATGLPDVRDDITNIANELEGIENQRDDEIAAVEDDPFVSAGSKQNKIARINKNYENRINNRVNKLTLLQKTQQDARQQAQFAATTAINLFGKQQEFQQNKLEDILDRQEKAAEAERKLQQEELANSPLKVENIGGFKVLRNSGTGAIISTEKPSSTSGTDGGGGFSSSIEGWANILSQGQGTISNVPTNIRSQVVNYLNTNSVNINKQLSDGAITQITQTQSAIDSLDDLRKVISGNLQFIGPIKGIQRFNPWSDARKAQADVDRVRQTVGKALEGGVLRKEDEEKYKKILATLGDTPETALYKIDSLVSTLQRDTQTFKEAQSGAGRFVEGVSGGSTGGGSTLSSTDARSKYNY